MEGEPLSFAGAATSWPHLGCSAQRLNGDFLLQKPSPSALSETPASSRASLSSPRTTRALGSMTGGLSEDQRSSLRLKGTSLEGAGAARPGPSQGLGAAIFAWAPGSEGKAPWQHKAQASFRDGLSRNGKKERRQKQRQRPSSPLFQVGPWPHRPGSVLAGVPRGTRRRSGNSLELRIFCRLGQLQLTRVRKAGKSHGLRASRF